MGCFMKHQPLCPFWRRAGLLRMGNYLKRSAYPDFLPRCAEHCPCAAFRKESRMKLAIATNLDRKFRG